jgi:2-hydroxychromene-2-carboxylate isomerase
VEVTWCAFELRPEPVPTLDPKGEYLKRAWRDSVYPLSQKMGFNMKLPPVQPRSRMAHEAAHWARAAGCFNDYNLAIFRAFFEKGEDLGKHRGRVFILDRKQLRVKNEPMFSLGACGMIEKYYKTLKADSAL